MMELCELSSGYCGDFKIYTGEDKTSDVSASKVIVLQLSEPMMNKGHTVYTDNCYTSPSLCKKLLAQGNPDIGTAQWNLCYQMARQKKLCTFYQLSISKWQTLNKWSERVRLLK
uniref:PiggyBac transposable element-derived protein domain-containing protein n=1 Tax=Homalodisca liturata TaxID=320908 RepID=A0A1B6IZA3_9HEMI